MPHFCTEQTIKNRILHCTAAVDADYQFAAPHAAAFLPNAELRQCHRVTIIDDNILESTEHFEAVLSTEVDRVSVLTSSTRVAITDDDFVSVGFTQTQFTVDEDDPEQRRTSVCIKVTGETGTGVSVSVTSQPGSASGELAATT